MMGKPSRQKGKRGERECVVIARGAGFPEADRAWQTPQHDGDVSGIPGVYLEARRRESLRISEWAAEVEEKAGDRLPVLAFRRSNEPWRAVIPLKDLFALLANQRTAKLEGPYMEAENPE